MKSNLESKLCYFLADLNEKELSEYINRSSIWKAVAEIQFDKLQYDNSEVKELERLGRL